MGSKVVQDRESSPTQGPESDERLGLMDWVGSHSEGRWLKLSCLDCLLSRCLTESWDSN